MKQLKAILPLTTLTAHVVHGTIIMLSYWAETTEWFTRSPFLMLLERSSMYWAQEVLLHRFPGVNGTAILPSRRLLTLQAIPGSSNLSSPVAILATSHLTYADKLFHVSRNV